MVLGSLDVVMHLLMLICFVLLSFPQVTIKTTMTSDWLERSMEFSSEMIVRFPMMWLSLGLMMIVLAVAGLALQANLVFQTLCERAQVLWMGMRPGPAHTEAQARED